MLMSELGSCFYTVGDHVHDKMDGMIIDIPFTLITEVPLAHGNPVTRVLDSKDIT